MSASMASASMRHVASPRNVAGAFVSPKVSNSLRAVLRQAQGEPWSPHSVLPLKKSPLLSPYLAAALSPYSNERDHVRKISPEVSRKARTARKLPWSDGGKHKSMEGVFVTPDSICANSDILNSASPNHHKLPSVDTPDRAQTLKSLKQNISRILVLGKGSFGTVIEATYQGKPVAVKVAQPTPEACRQMQNERNCLILSHPHIISVFKVVLPQKDTAGVVIMERVLGYSLQKLLDNDFWTDKIRQRLRYSMQLSSALAYCHEKGVLHLDVKPQNILVDMFTNNCRLCDFGCSSQILAENFSLQGTVGYAAPEVLQGDKPTPAADVYSLGITMWQMMSGDTPYHDLRGHAVIYKVVSKAHRPYLPAVSCSEDEAFLSLIRKCWSQSAASRPSAQGVLQELILENEKSLC